ncbi:hypothetical protein QM012_001652 [Aureobasidium pullulans]|uniref:RRM domain-containing protein n=1 Tax=Aureobasidium pullulans TaxID=5580 RepID=A0ABR0TFK7_AURPU
MAYTTKDPHRFDNMEMIRRLATLETELRIEREQHALAQQCIAYVARQLAAQNHIPDIQPQGRTVEEHDCAADPSIQPELKQRTEPRSNGGGEEVRMQKVESEDLLTQDDDHTLVDPVHSPTLVSYKTRPVPAGPSFEKTSRTQCLDFPRRDEVKLEPVDDGKETDTEGTLFTFENSGDICSEALLTSDESSAQTLPVPGVQNGKSYEQPLTLKGLSDRYKDHKTMDKGIYASSWAATEKKVIDPEVQEDLMQFPETDEVFEDTAVAGLEEVMTEGQKEEAKQEHAAELRKNQALVMYDPAPSDDAFRTVLVTNIPEDRSEADVMRTVSGGAIVRIQSMDTRWITRGKTMMITFLHGKDACNFLRSVQDKVDPRFSLLKSPTYPINGWLADDMIYNGITRCLAIHGLHRDMTMNALCAATRQRGIKFDSVLSASRDEDEVCHLEFTSVTAAWAGYRALNDNLFRRFTRIIHEADPCDRKIPDMTAEETVEEEGDEARYSEDVEIEGAEDETEVESEAGAGAESESKASSADEKDADGWPVGGLDYD